MTDEDLIKSQAAEIERLRGELAKAVKEAFYEGFCEGHDGGWLWGDPTPAWKKSDAFAEVKVLKAKGAKP